MDGWEDKDTGHIAGQHGGADGAAAPLCSPSSLASHEGACSWASRKDNIIEHL